MVESRCPSGRRLCMLKTRSKALWLAAILACLTVLAGGCASLVDQDQPSSDPGLTVRLAAGHEVGQTFVAQHGGLDGVEFSLRNPSDRETTVQAHLRASPDSADDRASTSIVLPPSSTAAFYRFTFPALPDSHNRYFYVALSTGGTSDVQVDAAPGASYLNGSLYADGQPVEGQARFRASYAPGLALLELLRACLDALRALGVGLLAWVLPGWALLSVCLPVPAWKRLGGGEKLALAAGVGVGLYPVLLLWAATLGITLGNWLYWGPVGLAILLFAWRLRNVRRSEVLARLNTFRQLRPGLASVALIVAMLAVFVTRLLVVRSLDAPSWGDSVQHAVMTQLIAERGGLFSNWQPYAPYESLSVQYGFAANAAVVMRWLGLSAAQATVIAGQLLSGLAVLVLYPLALRLAKGNRWAGVVAVIVAGLISPMPGFYVNWGRYAQLAGQVVLPVAFWLLWEAAEQRSFSRGAVAAAGLTLAGMMLSYYRMPYYYAAFALSWFIFWAAAAWRLNLRSWLQGLARVAAVGVVGIALVVPWLGRVAGSTLAEGLERGMTRTLPVSAVILDYQQWRTVTDYAPLALLVAGGLALAWALLRRKGTVLMVGLWVALMAALVAGRLINLPGANLLQSFAVMILLYMPLGLVIGWWGGEIASWLASHWGRAGQAFVGTVLAGLVVWGALSQLRIVKRDFILVTRPDAQAMAWIERNTAGDAVFLAEGFRVYNGTSAVGSDAGWWTPLLAGRANTMPPQYAILNETPADPGYSQRLVELVASLESAAPGSDAGLSSLCGLGVTHVYVGQTQGGTGMGVQRLFAPSDLLADPHFSLVYHQDRVYIFAVASQACDVLAKVAK